MFTPHALAGQAQWWLRRRASGEVGHRDVGHGHEPGKTGRYELAERHQMNLAVALLAGRTRLSAALKYCLPSATAIPSSRSPCWRSARLLQRLEILVGNLVEESGQGGFGQHRELRRILLCQPVVGAQRIGEPLGTPFHFLRHVALQQGHRQWFTRHLRPADFTQQLAGAENRGAGEQRQRRDTSAARRACTAGFGGRQPAPATSKISAPEQRRKRDAMDAEQRRHSRRADSVAFANSRRPARESR
jgi:hypothetical protein